jgi:tRNA threonylcarbamoyladenosine modification (KEOPS) complex  Pcc1 subunit
VTEGSGSPWTATIRIETPAAEWGEWLEASLRPEAAREVPRAHATVHRDVPGSLRLEIEARDAGALRAALNTYLGWVQLAAGTLAAARAGSGPPG